MSLSIDTVFCKNVYTIPEQTKLENTKWVIRGVSIFDHDTSWD